MIKTTRRFISEAKWKGRTDDNVVILSLCRCLCAFAGGLIWYPGPLQAERFYASALLASLPVFGFFAALTARRTYGGTLSDPGGIPPVVVTVKGQHLRIDLNLVAEIAGLAGVILAVALYRF